MKKIFLPIIICFAAITAFAQTADIEVSYTAISPNMKNGKISVKNQYILLANGTESKFFSPVTEYIDSLNSTPEGAAKYKEMARNAYFGGKMKDMLKKDGSYYVLKSFTDSLVRNYDTAGLNKFSYDELPEKWEWEILDSTKSVLDYECTGATTIFHGRRWTVWFTPEIPVSNGPWKFDGLPGLILLAESEGGQYRFEATGLQLSDKAITPVYLADEYETTTRTEFLKEKRAFLDNTLSRLNAQLDGISLVKVEDENGNDISDSIFASRATVDFIETDY